MKIRNGFISNSSSSSFICEVCGEIQSGMNSCLNELGMMSCVKGHVFCNLHAVNTDKEIDGKTLEDFNNEDYGSNIPALYCPICQYKEISVNDIEKYLLIKCGYKNNSDVKKDIRKYFKTFEEFEHFIKSKLKWKS